MASLGLQRRGILGLIFPQMLFVAVGLPWFYMRGPRKLANVPQEYVQSLNGWAWSIYKSH